MVTANQLKLISVTAALLSMIIGALAGSSLTPADGTLPVAEPMIVYPSGLFPVSFDSFNVDSLADDRNDESAEHDRNSSVLDSVARRYEGDLFDAKNLPSTEAPDFQRHVIPLLGRLGCNGRACHGSFQGQGGFQLSLFGFDFDADHAAMLENRVDPEDVAFSPILTKPTDPDGHGGGMRFEENSWQYNLLYRWVEAGASPSGDEKRLQQIVVSPAEIVATDSSAPVQLQVVAEWEDGVREDVTDLCRFQSNDPAVATVTEQGVVSSTIDGDTFVIVFYDNAVTPVSVLHPRVSNDAITGDATRTPANTLNSTHKEIDRLVIARLNKLGIRQSELSDDATFLRRVSLDVSGTLPTSAEIRAFLADTDPGKRAKKIEQLLATPAYVALWTTFFCDLTGNNSTELTNVAVIRARASERWYDWIYKRVAENVPYDDLVEGIVLSSSREPGESYTEYCENMCDMYRETDLADNNPSDNNAFADRSTMPYYWMRQNFRDGPDRAIGFAHSFMGIRIQCAQCHKHPFDQWTQNDFVQFSRFFTGVSATNLKNKNLPERDEIDRLLQEAGLEKNLRGGKLRKEMAVALRKGKTIPFPELKIHPPALDRKDRRKRANRKQKYYSDAILLGSDAVDLTSFDDVRSPVMKWLTREDNPYFAPAIVNRVWAHYFGVGIVDPADDLNLANPPSNKPLLDYLVRGFVDSGYDMKWLHREITNSRTYQLSWEPNETNATDRHNFSHAIPRRLPAEVALDAVRQSVANQRVNAEFRTNLKNRAIAIAGTEPDAGLKKKTSLKPAYGLKVFGRSTRSNSCDCDRSNETSISQTVYLQNDRDIHFLLEEKESWAAELRKIHGMTNVTEDERREIIRLEGQIATLKRKQRELAAGGATDQSERLRGQMFELNERLTGLKARRAKPINPNARQLNADLVITEAYLRTLSRFPTEPEMQRCRKFLSEDKDIVDGVPGLMWALVNTKEFIVNH